MRNISARLKRPNVFTECVILWGLEIASAEHIGALLVVSNITQQSFICISILCKKSNNHRGAVKLQKLRTKTERNLRVILKLLLAYAPQCLFKKEKINLLSFLLLKKKKRFIERFLLIFVHTYIS